jgi:hypothetical protein
VFYFNFSEPCFYFF